MISSCLWVNLTKLTAFIRTWHVLYKLSWMEGLRVSWDWFTDIGMLAHMFSFCKLLLVDVLNGFTLLKIPRLENDELLILCDAIVLNWCDVMLYAVLITLIAIGVSKLAVLTIKVTWIYILKWKHLYTTLRCHDPIVIPLGADS